MLYLHLNYPHFSTKLRQKQKYDINLKVNFSFTVGLEVESVS